MRFGFGSLVGLVAFYLERFALFGRYLRIVIDGVIKVSGLVWVVWLVELLIH